MSGRIAHDARGSTSSSDFPHQEGRNPWEVAYDEALKYLDLR
jgi:hypothetical protein